MRLFPPNPSTLNSGEPMSGDLDLSSRINLKRATALIVDGNPESLNLMRQVLAGFGVRMIHASATPDEARRLFTDHTLDLMVIDPLFIDNSGFEFIRWTRRQENSQNRCIAIIAALGHQTLHNVQAARDAGANSVVSKPLSPEVMLQRIAWVAREKRQFIVAPGYVGPDRRFKNEGPPAGKAGRRADDLSLTVPDAVAANMSQSEVDNLFKPRKVAL
jgi:DNA-binding response OmpR family regulator